MKTIYKYKKDKISKNKHPRSRLQKNNNILLYIVIFLLVIIIGFISFVSYHFYLSQSKAKPIKQIVAVHKSFTEQYMQDLLGKNYAEIWKLYAPTYQTFIQNTVGKNAYLSFLQQKFSDVHYGHISITPCVSGQTIFPYGVERSYNNTCVSYLKVSLTTQNASASSQLYVFSNLPVVLTKSGKTYQIVGGGPTDLQAPVLSPPSPVSNTKHIPIIMYHLIQPIPLRSHYESDYAWKLDVGLTVTPQAFSMQMDQLQKQGYHTISPNDLFNNLYYNLPLPSKPIILTFDDGRISDYTNGLPILLQHHYTAIFFIPPGLSGKVNGMDGHNTYMSLDQVKELTQDGMYVENHSLYHTAPLWNLKPSTLQLQLSEANSDLLNVTHYPIQFIAYDGSWPSRNWQKTTPAIQQTMNVLSNMGFILALQDTDRNDVIEDTQFPYQIPRVRGVNSDSISFITNAPIPRPSQHN